MDKRWTIGWAEKLQFDIQREFERANTIGEAPKLTEEELDFLEENELNDEDMEW